MRDVCKSKPGESIPQQKPFCAKVGCVSWTLPHCIFIVVLTGEWESMVEVVWLSSHPWWSRLLLPSYVRGTRGKMTSKVARGGRRTYVENGRREGWNGRVGEANRGK